MLSALPLPCHLKSGTMPTDSGRYSPFQPLTGKWHASPHYMTSHSRKTPGQAPRNQFRIIGGNWRSRKLTFPGDVPSLRPTADRIRETLFNWLQFKVPGARCLDLFAGSGALAFEALSRGAASVTAVDASTQVAAALRDNASLLECTDLDIVTANARDWLVRQEGQDGYDIIFLDPPFSQDLLSSCLENIVAYKVANPGCVIYMESGSPIANISLPMSWELSRNKKAGQVFYGVCEAVLP
jgi:16S rRNA (guanine966-N2)-methyltransferase